MVINSISSKTSSFSVPITKESIYVLGLNRTHSVTDEMVINFPENCRKHNMLSLSLPPVIYILVDIIFTNLSRLKQKNEEQNMYLIDLTAHNARIEDLSFNSSTSTLAISVQTDDNSLSSAPAIKVSIPKSLQSGVLRYPQLVMVL